MIAAGNVTIHVSDMDAAVRFYTSTLGLSLTHRLGGAWASIAAGASYWTTDAVGAGLTIGLKPRSAADPPAGSKSSVMFGLETYEPIDVVAEALGRAGVRQSEIIRSGDIGNFLGIEDLEGNDIYLWEIVPEMVPEEQRHGAGVAQRHGMFTGGHANVYVSNMDRAVRFYTEVLGLPLTNRFGDNWATVEAGRSLVLGIHPQSPRYPAPGTKGATVLGLTVNEPMERILSRLAKHGVCLAGGLDPTRESGSTTIEDPDGNTIELSEPTTDTAAETLLTAVTRR